MSDPLYSDSDFSAGNAQDPIAGIQESPINEFQHPSVIATANKLGHVKGGGNIIIDPDGTIRAPEPVAPTWNNITGKPDTFPPSAHNHSVSSFIGTANKLFGSDENGLAKERKAIQQIDSSASSGIIAVGENVVLNLTTVFDSTHTLSIAPDVPDSITDAPITMVYFTTGATKPSITLVAPTGYSFNWRHPELTDWEVSKYYTIQFVWISSTRCDIYYLIS